MLFLACLVVVSLYVTPYYLIPFDALRDHRDASRTIKARAVCSFCSCTAISFLLFAVVAFRLRFDGSDGDSDENARLRRHHLVEARLALSDPFAWLRASFPVWLVRSLAPSLAEAVASSLGAGRGAASAWRAAAAEAAEARLPQRGGGSSSSFVPSPAAATLRLLGLSPLSAALPGALVGVLSVCCLLAWPLSQRLTELFFEGGGEESSSSSSPKRKQRWWRRLRSCRCSSKRETGSAPSSHSFFRFPPATVLRDLVIAPLTEEVAFRGCLLPMLLLLLPLLPPPSGSAAATTTAALAASSAAFASAHLHHAAATLLSPHLPREHQRAVLKGALVQFFYTFAFGAVAGALMLSTGSLVAPVAAHSLANFLGLPRKRRKEGNSSSSSGLLRRFEDAAGLLGVSAFAAMAAGWCFGGAGAGRDEASFAPFLGVAGRLGAAGHGKRYRALAAALSPAQ